MPKIRPLKRVGHFVRVDNTLFDFVMPNVSSAAWKVFSFIIRKTIGWNDYEDELSFSQIREGTGIKTNATLSKAIKELERFNGEGVIITTRRTVENEKGQTQHITNNYSLNQAFEVEVDEKGRLVQKMNNPSYSKNEQGGCSKNEHTKDILLKDNTTTTPAQNSDFPITPDELRQMGQPVPEAEQPPNALGQISDLYLSNIGGISPIIGDAMKAYMDDILAAINRQPFHTGESVLSWFQYAINEAVDNDKRNWGYVKAILEGVIKSGSLKAHKVSRPSPATNGKVKAMPELTPAQEEAAEVMRVGLGGVKTPQREAEVRAAIIALFSDGSLTGAEGMRRYLVEYRNSWMGKDSPHPASPRRILDTWGPLMEPAQNGGGEGPVAIPLTDEQKEAARKLNELYG